MLKADISIEVIGGSISACTDSNQQECYVNLLERALQLHSDRHGSGTVTVINRALPAVGSEYFSQCGTYGEGVDLIIIELAVNDFRVGKVGLSGPCQSRR